MTGILAGASAACALGIKLASEILTRARAVSVFIVFVLLRNVTTFLRVTIGIELVSAVSQHEYPALLDKSPLRVVFRKG